MSEQNFIIKKHFVPCQHIREEFITSSPDDPAWKMQVQQYTPRNNPSPKEGDITILSSHANGFPRELYEPFWDDLFASLTTKSLNVRNIFIITPSHLSSSINPGLIADGSREPDTSRDLLLLVNHFRQSILHPIVGIGHSIGASQLTSLSLIHPSLFTSLVLIEPIIGTDGSKCSVEKLALAAITRRREWKSLTEAENHFRKAWGNWDPRVIERWNTSALVPTDGSKPNGKVQLSWNRLQELTCYMDMSELRASADEQSDFKMQEGKGTAVWTSYPLQLWERLKDLSVHTLYVCGEKSPQAQDELKKYWRESTGVNEKFWMRGSNRRVELLEMRDMGHLMPLEAPGKCAEIVGTWIDEEMKSWWKEWEKKRKWRQLSQEKKGKAVEGWMTGLKSRI